MTQIEGTCGTTTAAQFEQNPIDSDVNPHVKAHVDAVEDSYMERIADLELQITNGDDPQRALQLQDEIMRLENAFDDFKSSVDDLSRSEDGIIGMTFGAMSNAVNADALEDVVSEFRQEISNSYAEFGTDQVPCEIENLKPAWEPMELARFDRDELDATGQLRADIAFRLQSPTPGDSGYNTGTTTSAGQSPGATTAGTAGEQPIRGGVGDSTEATAPTGTAGAGSPIDGRSPEDMMNLMSNDPDAFYNELQQMDPEDRQMMMTMVQQQLQEMNQMFQMISQFQQAIHDTQKAVIQNMRV